MIEKDTSDFNALFDGVLTVERELDLIKVFSKLLNPCDICAFDKNKCLMHQCAIYNMMMKQK